MKKPKVAIIHDFAFKMGGAEKCVESFCELYSDADVFMLFGDTLKLSKIIQKHNFEYSFLNKIPGIRKFYRYTFPFWPLAIESFDLSEYDLVISQSTVVAKGVLTDSDTLHVCYMNAPMRYCWDLRHKYFNPENFSFLKRLLIPFFLLYLRVWDVIAQNRADKLIVNSEFQRKRVEKYYKVESDRVIYPPVALSDLVTLDFDNVTQFNGIKDAEVKDNPEGGQDEEEFFLSVAPFAPNKNGKLILEAAKRYGFKLKIIGTGQFYKKFIKKYQLENVEFLGWVSEKKKWEIMVRAKGLIMAGIEDFGIAPLEAMYCGTPVIAYSAGGALETVKNGETGLFFDEFEIEDLYAALKRVDSISWDVDLMRDWVRKFGKDRFKNEIEDFVQKSYNNL